MSEITVDTSLKRLKIGTTDVFLENLGPGRGKIIIADPYGGNYSYFWGSMGSSLEEFILGLDFGYFHGKVNPHDYGVFNGKRTIKEIRRVIREEFSYDLPWYKYMSAQKEFREYLRELEDCDTDRQFIDQASDLSSKLDLDDLNIYETADFRRVVESILEEPWHYIVNGPSKETIFLEKLFIKLQKTLKKELKGK